MKEFANRVAVVTGAASGIGRALAEHFGAERMKVVLADIEAGPLEEAGRKLEAQGVECATVLTDVTKADQVQALAERTLELYGAVHVVCNNAGVFAGGLAWETTTDDWDWVLGVNLFGVIYGIKSFVPLLLEQGEDGHVVNTASMAGLCSAPFTAPYTVSKHGVVALSEVLHHELTARQSSIGVTVLCPEAIATGIGDSSRNRPAAPDDRGQASPERDLVEGALRSTVAAGLPPERMAERVLDAIREQRFWAVPPAGDTWRNTCEARLEDIRLARNPGFAPPVEAE